MFISKGLIQAYKPHSTTQITIKSSNQTLIQSRFHPKMPIISYFSIVIWLSYQHLPTINAINAINVPKSHLRRRAQPPPPGPSKRPRGPGTGCAPEDLNDTRNMGSGVDPKHLADTDIISPKKIGLDPLIHIDPEIFNDFLIYPICPADFDYQRGNNSEIWWYVIYDIWL